MNTTENNKIIQKFMNHYKNMGNIGLLYNKDWNWLMEVINKLTTLNEFQDYEFKSLFWDTFCQLDIEEVYTQVVLFIEWYNEQK
jgi:hypothetical protein